MHALHHFACFLCSLFKKMHKGPSKPKEFKIYEELYSVVITESIDVLLALWTTKPH